MDITLLKGKIPDTVFAQLQDTTTRFNIDSVLKLAHFLGQCDFESIHFSAIRENLSYSADALLRVFSRYFDQNSANIFAHQPEKIGNRVYANRIGNGNESSGDGYNYRGRGYIQLTGRSNYKDFGNTIGQDLVAKPDLVATDYPLASAAYFFKCRNLFTVCQQGPTPAVVTSVTRIVNGGLNGLPDRIISFNKYFGWLSAANV